MTEPTSTFRELIQHACDTNVTTRKALAIASECDEETVRRWLSGQIPATRCLRRMLSRASLLPHGLKLAMAEWFLRGSDFAAVDASSPDRTVLDPNCDGIVDAKDVSVFALQSIERAANAAGELRKAVAGGRLNEAERSAARAALHEAVAAANNALAALDHDGTVRLAV